jgi:hypothetical protein
MYNQKDIIAQNIKILNNKDITVINNNDEDYIFSALTVEGGGVFKKGIALGVQEKMVPGLMIYDSENFYGFSEKFGLCLLSPHLEYSELEIPESTFNDRKDINKLQPVLKNDNEHFQDLKDTEKNKVLNIDLNIKDVNNFFIIIPSIYSESNIKLTFDITYIYDLNSIISNLTLSFINESNKQVFFNIKNDDFYYEDNFNNIIEINAINKINVEIINEDYFMVSKKIYKKKN